MKKIGLIGGMSWESTVVYYEIINQLVSEKLGGFHSANCILESVDFAEIVKYQHLNNWEKLDELMANVARNLEHAGAELIVLCTNTMHLCADRIVREVSVPFLHIAEATGRAIIRQKIDKVLLLGTKFTMERDFYRKTLEEHFSVETMIPSEEDRSIIHEIIYGELVHGMTHEVSRNKYQRIIEKAVRNGVQGVVLGCTEIPLLIKERDCAIPVFDTTKIHAERAVELALGE